MSFSDSRSMWTTNRSPTAVTGSPVAAISMPEASIDTCPSGSVRTPKIVAGSAAIARLTSMRAAVMPAVSRMR